MFRKAVTISLATAVASVVSLAAPVAPAGAAAGDGLIATMTGSCTGIDAKTATWDWTKPSLEMSTDGTTFGAATGFGVGVCRETGTSPKYWFQILKADGTKELGGDATNKTFRVTVPPKSGDNFIYASGYSNMTSFSTSGGSAVVITKPASLSKINFGNDFNQFLANHPECAGKTMQNWNTCNIETSDEDFTATVIQHIAYSTTTLTSVEQNMLGLWVGANVNGFQIAMSCSGSGVSGSSVPAVDDGSSVTIGGKTYTKIAGTSNYLGPDGKTYTPADLQALYNSSSGSSGSGGYSGNTSDGGANMPGGTSGGTSSSGSYELRITMQGTPHKKRDGSLNKGSMKAFITSAIAKKCFGDGKAETTLQQIADKLTMTRTATGETSSTPAFTVAAVTAPAEGLLITVAEMTFSNPEYTIKSTLSAYLASAATNSGSSSSGGSTSGGTTTGGSTSGGTTTGGSTTGGTTTGGTTSGDTSAATPASSESSSYTLTKKGSKATIKIVLIMATTVKIYRKTSGVAKLVKTLAGKKGTNSYVTTWKTGYSYIIRSSKGLQLAVLK